MTIFVNERNEIKDVNTTDLDGLIALEVDDNNNPFANWSVAKICCYKVYVVDGKVTMLTPYVDTRIIEHIDQLGKQIDNNTSGIQINSEDIVTTQEGLAETYEGTNKSITQLEEALTEVYEMIVPQK